MHGVKISTSNMKMGRISSVSLPAIVTCRECDCHSVCYAKKIARIRPNVAASYRHNLDLLNTDPDKYWREVEGAIMMNRFFRFHVSGDIPDEDYFNRMIDVASRNAHCEILCFTKKYEIVNKVLKTRAILPLNLHIIFSAWIGLDMANPFSLPTAHVRRKDGSTTAKIGAKECGGNCETCAITNDGCWTLKNGEQVIFDEH